MAGNERKINEKKIDEKMINEENYVDMAEKIISELRNPRGEEVTTSKLRNLLSMTASIYNDVMNQKGEELNPDICARISYLRLRLVYEAGRENSVKSLVEKADLINFVKNINKSKKRFILFNRYMEALVAFHKYHGGKDY